MNIITGYTGTPHITSTQDRDGNQGAYGTGSYILNVGNKMAATIISANEIRIADGILSHQGCLGSINSGSYDSVAISNGTQGMQRRDLIVCRYEKNAETNVESLSLVVIEGTAASSSPATPSYNDGDIQTGDSPVDMPLYRVNINGVTVSSVTLLADTVMTQAESDALIGSTDISSIGNGTLTGAISTLNGKTNLGSSYTNSLGTSPDGISIVKKGNVAHVAITYPSITVANDTQIGVLPSAIKSSATAILGVINRTSGAPVGGTCWVSGGTNAIRYYGAAISSTRIMIEGVMSLDT